MRLVSSPWRLTRLEGFQGRDDALAQRGRRAPPAPPPGQPAPGPPPRPPPPPPPRRAPPPPRGADPPPARLCRPLPRLRVVGPRRERHGAIPRGLRPTLQSAQQTRAMPSSSASATPRAARKPSSGITSRNTNGSAQSQTTSARSIVGDLSAV